MNKCDVICIGEVLVDLISQESGKKLSEATLFRKFAGGAPANVAVGLARLGCNAGFAGKIGPDSFGRFLKKYLDDNGVNTEALFIDSRHKTRLAFVEVAADGERDFEFIEKYPADSALKADDFSVEMLNSVKIVHFGSLPLTTTAGQQTFVRILENIDDENVITSFDPNYRPSLWKSPREARRVLGAFSARCQILKVSLEEAEFLSGTSRINDWLLALYGPKTRFLAITTGKCGCILKNRRHTVEVPGFAVQAVDTTGCGDAFIAGLLAKLIESGKLPEELNESELITFGRFANAAAAQTAMRYGATETLPSFKAIDMFIKSEKGKKEAY